jgi:hypothetical protein
MPAPSTHATPIEEKDDEKVTDEKDLTEQDNTTDPLLNSPVLEKYADVQKVGEALPVTSYAGLMALYAALFSFLIAHARKDNKLHEPMEWRELFIFSLAVFHLSRTISKGWITIPLRAPFAQYEEPSVLPSEVHEKPRGKGVRRVLGELLTCPFCLGTWVGLGLGYGWVFAPRATRLITTISATAALSNFLHLTYTMACKKTQE